MNSQDHQPLFKLTYLTVLPALKSANTFARSASDIAIKPSRSALEPLPVAFCLRNILHIVVSL